MKDPRLDKLAANLLDYSLDLQPGERVSIEGESGSIDLMIALVEAAYARGAVPFVEIGDERETITRDMLVESPIHIPHRVLNESAGVFRCLVVKTPRPTQSTRVL